MKARYGIGRYVIIAAIVAFLGWALETLLTYAVCGVWQDRGFLRLPLCPIYATAVLTTYFLFGTPREGGVIFKKLGRGWLRSTLYLLVCFLLPSLIELAVGYFFDTQFNTCLWSYEHMPCHIGGYVCLPFSLGWTALLFVFMRWIFPLLKRGIGKLPKWLCNALAILLTIFILLDTFTQAAALTSYDFSFCAPYDCIFRENRVQ